jgi:hypothetical protein
MNLVIRDTIVDRWLILGERRQGYASDVLLLYQIDLWAA